MGRKEQGGSSKREEQSTPTKKKTSFKPGEGKFLKGKRKQFWTMFVQKKRKKRKKIQTLRGDSPKKEKGKQRGEGNVLLQFRRKESTAKPPVGGKQGGLHPGEFKTKS